MPKLLLVRHCESSGQDSAAPLTERGREQAAGLAIELARYPIDHVVTSPYLRARETIAPFAEQARLRVYPDEALAERRLSPEPIDRWQDEIRKSFIDLDHRLPGGESGREALVRGWAALAVILAGGYRLPVVVSHGQLLALVLHSLDPSFGFSGWESLSNPDVYLLENSAAGRLRFTRVWSQS